MKCVATFPSYEQANERQLDLLAADIAAAIHYVPNGVDQVYFGANPIYALLVGDDQVEDAVDLLRLIPDPEHKCLFRCPSCETPQVRELALEQGFGTGPFSLPLTFGAVAAIRLLRVRLLGRKYECLECGTVYRKKP